MAQEKGEKKRAQKNERINWFSKGVRLICIFTVGVLLLKVCLFANWKLNGGTRQEHQHINITTPEHDSEDVKLKI